MTLVLAWQNGPKMLVIADTLLSSRGVATVEAAPKIFPIPIRVGTFEDYETTPRNCLDMGFAFAGHTAAGQMTHALASAGCMNLTGKQEAIGPSVEAVALYYARCAVRVVDTIRRNYPFDDCLFESLVFGWEGEVSLAYSLEIKIDANAKAIANVEQADFTKFPVYGMGIGMDAVEDFFKTSYENGHKASPHDALEAIIRDRRFPTVGGRIQAALVDARGVQLKPVLWVDASGRAEGGYMGFDQTGLGNVGDLSTLSTEAIALSRPAQ